MKDSGWYRNDYYGTVWHVVHTVGLLAAIGMTLTAATLAWMLGIFWGTNLVRTDPSLVACGGSWTGGTIATDPQIFGANVAAINYWWGLATCVFIGLSTAVVFLLYWLTGMNNLLCRFFSVLSVWNCVQILVHSGVHFVLMERTRLGFPDCFDFVLGNANMAVIICYFLAQPFIIWMVGYGNVYFPLLSSPGKLPNVRLQPMYRLWSEPPCDDGLIIKSDGRPLLHAL